MVGFGKQEFPPLLKLGFHRMTWRQLLDLCVVPFVQSATRPLISAGLAHVCGQLNACKIDMEMWVNGSFLTKKVDPEDSDVVVRISSDDLDVAHSAQCKLLDVIVQEDYKSQYRCDFYCFVEYPNSHERAADGEWMRAYWIRQFGFSRADTPKGLALLEIPVEMI